MEYSFVCDKVHEALKKYLPEYWDGKESICFMRDNGCRNWRQMEWPGWYFQFQCERILKQSCGFEVPGPKYGNVEFDGLCEIPWDFKVHTNNSSSGAKVPTNGYQEVLQALQTYEKVGFIIACGDAVFDDENKSFKIWHDNLKGKTSKYEQERIKRGASSRRRKAGFSFDSLEFVFVDRQTIGYCGTFQTGMRNSDGSPRNAKVMIDLNDSRLEHISLPI